MMQRDELDGRIVAALERMPDVTLSVDFAAQVATRAAAQPKLRAVPAMSARYGQAAMRLSAAVLLVALVALSMVSAGRTAFGIAMQWTLCAQLMGLMAWMGLRGRVLRG
jgi:hypothetical protein